MKRKGLDFDTGAIEPSEHTPIVSMLLSVIETLQIQLSSQSEKIDLLLSEIRRLKKISNKPKLRASKLPKSCDDNDEDQSGNKDATKRAGSAKRSKS